MQLVGMHGSLHVSILWKTSLEQRYSHVRGAGHPVVAPWLAK